MEPLLRDPASWLRIPSWPAGWDGLHPWVVHCPIALFLTAPVFVFLAMILFHRGRWMSLTALVLLGLGLVGTSVSISTGLAARDYLNQTAGKLSAEAAQVLEKHLQLASSLLPLYGGLFVIYLVLFLLSIAVRPFDNPVWLFFMNLVFLILLALGGLVVVNTGELGGRLVHEFGIQGRIGPIRPEAEKPPTPEPKPPEEKPTPKAKPEKKLTPKQPPVVKEKPGPEEKPPELKEKPGVSESLEKPTPPEEPKEKPRPEKPEAPAKEKPSEKAPEPEPEKKPLPEEKPTKKAEEKPSAEQSDKALEESSPKEPASGQQKSSEKDSNGKQSGSEPKAPSSSPPKSPAQQNSSSPDNPKEPPPEDNIASQPEPVQRVAS